MTEHYKISEKNRNNKRKTKSTNLIGWILLLIGVITLGSSIIFSSTLLAFIGLGLTFWGPLLLYIVPEKQVNKTIIESTLPPYIENLTQILKEMRYLGKAVYLPPKYMKNFDECKIFIPQRTNTKLPSPEWIQEHSDDVLLEHPKALLLDSPGHFLVNLFEKKLGTSFTQTDFKYLQQNLPKLLVQELEIVDEFELEKSKEFYTESIDSIEKEYEFFKIKFSNSIFRETDNAFQEYFDLNETIGFPICSAIASALAKSTGNPIIIQKIDFSNTGITIEAKCRSLEPIKRIEKKSTIIASPKLTNVKLETFQTTTRSLVIRPKFDFKMFLLIVGIIMSIWIVYLTLNDVYTWGKDLATILFSSREGELISLGIDMRVIHYLLITLGFLISGLLLKFTQKD